MSHFLINFLLFYFILFYFINDVLLLFFFGPFSHLQKKGAGDLLQ